MILNNLVTILVPTCNKAVAVVDDHDKPKSSGREKCHGSRLYASQRVKDTVKKEIRWHGKIRWGREDVIEISCEDFRACVCHNFIEMVVEKKYAHILGYDFQDFALSC